MPLRKAVQPRIGVKTKTGTTIGASYYGSFLPLDFFNPIYEGIITSNTSTVFTLSNISSIGSLMTANYPYIIQTDMGSFFIDTTSTKTSNNATLTIDTTTYSFLRSPTVNTNNFSNKRCIVRQLLRLADILTQPPLQSPQSISGLNVSGILQGVDTGTADQFLMAKNESIVSFIFYNDGFDGDIDPMQWQLTTSFLDQGNSPAPFISVIIKRDANPVSFEVTKTMPRI